MRKYSLSLIVVCCWLTAAAFGQDISGTWAGAIEASDFVGAIRLDVPAKSDGSGSSVTIFYAGDKRNGAIEDLKVTGSAVTFLGKMQPQARFTGTLAGERISGTFEMVGRNGQVSGTGVWDARRVDANSITEPQKTEVARASFTPSLPKPTGRYAVGRKFFYWTDESRQEVITDDPNDKRKVFVQLWYPAAAGAKGKAAEYFADAQELLGGDGDYREVVKSIRTHTVTDASVAKVKSKIPLLVFSPGLGTSSFHYAGIIENLVSHGYAVAAISHPYDSGPFGFADGTVVRYATDKWNREAPKDWTAEQRIQFMNERRFEWAKDASFVVDQLQKQNSPVTKRLDFANLGMFGHSFGGQAASIVCAADPRFKACANLDGMAQGSVVLADQKGSMLKQPFMFFTKAPEVTDFELKMMGMTRTEYRERDARRMKEKWNPSYKTRLAELPSGAYLLVLPRASHSSFGDSPLLNTQSPQPYEERLAMLRVINDHVLAFFDKTLRDDRSTILDKPIPNPTVTVQFLKK